MSPRTGGTHSGDTCVIHAVDDGILVAVIDGSGHGPEAARAVERATRAISTAESLDVIPVIRLCNDLLPATRSVVMGIAACNTVKNTLTWLAVGNIAGHVVRAHPLAMPRSEMMITRGGTLGLHLPHLVPNATPLHAGDLLILATEGLIHGIAHGASSNATPQGIANGILATHAFPADDALVFVARYLGLQGATV